MARQMTKRGQGQWALGHLEPLNPAERFKKDELHGRQRLYYGQNVREADPFPLVVESAPACDAVEVGDVFELRLGEKLFPGP